LKTGIRWADEISTVSPTYAREIVRENYGMGLQDVLRSRQGHVTGILNGIDTDVWNPATDPYIAQTYTARTIAKKEKNKEDLLSRAGLPYEEGVPVIGMISRLTAQKGIELLQEPLPELLALSDVRVVVLGSGEARLEEFFSNLVARFPKKVAFKRGFDDPLAHRIEAGADMFLMPSIYEPCGLNQMYSLKYGTIPIVRKTGGLADSVRLFDRATGEGNGIVFDHPNSDAVRWAFRYAMELFEDRKTWKKLVKNAMAADTSWKVQAKEYVALYERMSARAGART
jgi:starch synthase